MRKVSVIVAALVWLLLVAEARADTVFLKDGRNIWASEAYEEDNTVVLVRPGGEMRFPKAEVIRIERTRSSLPPFYSIPTTPPAGPGAPPSPGAPAAPGSPPTAGTPSGAPTPPGGGSPGTPPGPRPPARTPTSD